MPRYGAPVLDAPEWIGASVEHPCPICGATSACSRLEAEPLARCCMTVSERPILPDGWLHALTASGSGDVAEP